MSIATLLYLAAILTANVVTARSEPLAFGPFLVPWGTWLIGATLVLRDFVQLRHGRRTAYVAIAAALVLSALTSAGLGDPVAITGASAVAFGISESIDTEIFSRLKASVAGRILMSGAVASLADSALFIVLGLSPLTTGFIPWAAVPSAIAGQYVVKTAMTAMGAATSTRLRALFSYAS